MADSAFSKPQRALEFKNWFECEFWKNVFASSLAGAVVGHASTTLSIGHATKLADQAVLVLRERNFVG